MSKSPKLFISFSSKDQNEVRKLFSAFELQNIKVWDYSDIGQELPLAHELNNSLKEKIELCEYFLAIISPNTIDEQIGRNTRFEVSYAIKCGKLQQNRILPILLKDPSDAWQDLYTELQHLLWINLNINNQENFDDCIRRICEWMSASYIPPTLQDTRIFFAQLFLKEAESKQLSNANFVKLLRIMNGCANKVLENEWKGAKEKIDYFLSFIDNEIPFAKFHYPLVIRGVCELQLKQFENARQTFLLSTENQDLQSNPLIGLGFAGLGHTHFSLGNFQASQHAFQKALNFLPEDDSQFQDDVQFNLIGALLQENGIDFEEGVLDRFDLSKLSFEERLKVITLKGAAKYKKGKFWEAVQIFQELNQNEVTEAAGIYYALSLKEIGLEDEAINILKFASDKIKTTNLYHYLADTYLCTGRIQESLCIYEEILCDPQNLANWTRQYFIEYAQILKFADKINNQEKVSNACKKVLDPASFPLPYSKEDFFYTGFAYYLLGRQEEARFDYNRSLDFCLQYYDEIELCSS